MSRSRSRDVRASLWPAGRQLSKINMCTRWYSYESKSSDWKVVRDSETVE